MKRRLIIFSMVALAFLLTCVAIAGGTYFRAGEATYTLEIGLPSDRPFFAPREVLDFVTTEQNRLEAYEHALDRATNPLHQIRYIDPMVWTTVVRNIEAVFTEFGDIRAAYHEEMDRIAAARAMHNIDLHHLNQQRITEQQEWDRLRNEIIAAGGDEAHLPERPADFEPTPEQEWVEPVPESLALFGELPVFFTEVQQLHLLYMPEYEITRLWEITWEAARSVQTGAIREWEQQPGESERVLLAIRWHLDQYVPDRITNDIAYEIVSRHVQPNHFVDQEATERRRQEEADNYERAYILAGERVIDVGEIVTLRAFRVLDYLGYIGGETDWRDTLRDATWPLLGKFVLSAALFFTALMYLFFYRPAILSNQKEAGLLFILYILVLALVWVLREQPYQFLPMLVFPMLVSILIDRRCAIILSLSLVFVGYFIIDGSLAYLLFYTISSIIICLLSRYTTQRSKIFLVGFLVTAIQFALSISIAFTLERHLVMNDLQFHLTTAGFAAINGLLTVIICVGSLPFWEALFGVVTPIKLLDLTNPTNLLLRRLTIEAPGTYHHSLMVANLAESAAYDIEANAHAARVGGYYHDVGKLKFPHFFAENINGENPHEHLEPINSAGLIISHVTYGLTLAAQHRLPQFVRDIIREHHGTSLMQYFYVKAKEADPTVTEEDYRYPYTIPQTRESACVMLADTVEAAVRSMMAKLKSVDEIEMTIRNLVRNKLNDGQLAESQLSIKDLEIIEASFTRVMKSSYHERIAYPKIEPEVMDPRDPPLIRGMVKKEDL